MTDPGRSRLASWKEIAAYLGREVRTVIRWEKERGLPVHRLPGGRGRSVFAFTDELDRWAAGAGDEVRPHIDSAAPAAARSRVPRSRWLVAFSLAGVVCIAGLAAGLPRVWGHQEIVRITAKGSTIQALGRGDKPVWSYELPEGSRSLDRRLTQAVDLSGDGHTDAVASAVLSVPEHDIGEGRLLALDESGRLLWQRALDQRLTFGAGDFEAPWMPDEVTAYSNGGEPLVAWAVHHLTWWPSMVTVFDARGSRIGTFVNAGWLRTVRPTLDGRHLVAGGFSNSYNGAAFAVLDARRPDGTSPEVPGSAYECRNCPAGKPLRYLVVEWSDIASSLPPDERDVVVSVHPGSGNIELRAKQRRNAEFIVELSPTLEITRRAASDSFWEWHEQFERNGTVTHGRQSCPYRDGPVVRAWSPGQGWTLAGRSETPPSADPAK